MMMRIISGKYKGKAVKMPKLIRPTQNKVRKAIFDILGDMEGVSFLDLFAGSGSVGFEALSRGSSELILVECNRDCQLAIKENIALLKLNSCSLYPQEVDRALKLLSREQKKFGVIFLDPPYRLGLAKKTLQTLNDYDILAPNGFVVVQHDKKDILPDDLGVFSLIKRAHYGDTFLSFYQTQLQ